MKRLIIRGDPGIRKGGIIDYDGTEQTLFQVTRNGDWHGPDRVQLWCVIGAEDERGTYQRQEFIPLHLAVDTVDAEAVDVIQAKGEPAARQ